MKQTYYTVAIFALVAIGSAQAAGGIKGQIQQQQDNSQQRIEAIKGPRQQFQPIRITPLALPPPPPQAALIAPAAPLSPPIKTGPGQITPVFNSKRPAQPVPIGAALAAAPLAPAVISQQPIVQQLQQEPEQQQVQEPSEIDPNAAAQEGAPAIAAIAAPASSEEEANPKPEPYAFQYAFNAGDAVSSGSSSREEQQDASGRVTGFYTLRGQDGRDRRVDYFADATGFHATINTNEMGTAPKDPADTRFQAQEPTDAQLRTAESATQAARQRALLAPQASPAQFQERIPAASSASASKLSSPRSKAQAAPQPARQIVQARQEAESIEQAAIAQLQEPIEQIRQTELNSRARKSRHAPFYLFTV